MESIKDILDSFDNANMEVPTGDLEESNSSKRGKKEKSPKGKKKNNDKVKDPVITAMKTIGALILLVGIGLLVYRGMAIVQDEKVKDKTRDIVKMHEKEKDPEDPKGPSLVERLQEEFGNKGIVGYISFPDAGIDYPVLHAENNEHYLNHDPYNNYSMNGSIYLDCDNKDDFTDFSNVIYGHHMNNGSMFGSLIKLTQGNIEGKSFTLHSIDKKYTYNVISYEAIDPNDREFYLGRWTDTKKEYIQGLQDRASQYIGTGKEKKYVTLVTCHYTNLGTIRYGITGGLVKVEESD